MLPDGAEIDRGVVGEFGLLLMFERTTAQGTALRAARGWGGDHYVSWKRGSQTCVRARLVMDTPTDRAELVDALRQWATATRTATVDAPANDPTVSFTACR